MDSRRPNQKNKIRLHKYLALCGIGSRRSCERLIEAGRISVDHQTVRQQGVCIDPATQIVMVDGKCVLPQKKITLLLNKPRNVICTSHDPRKRCTFLSLLPPLPARVYTVGRLDRNSEGLLIITNDGALAYALTHPKYNIEKVYYAWINKKLMPLELSRIKKGVYSTGDLLQVKDIDFLKRSGKTFLYRIGITEGKNRHIRRLFEAIDVEIQRLQRVAIGSLKLGSLRCGAWRYLKDFEFKKLLSDISACKLRDSHKKRR